MKAVFYNPSSRPDSRTRTVNYLSLAATSQLVAAKLYIRIYQHVTELFGVSAAGCRTSSTGNGPTFSLLVSDFQLRLSLERQLRQRAASKRIIRSVTDWPATDQHPILFLFPESSCQSSRLSTKKFQLSSAISSALAETGPARVISNHDAAHYTRL